MIQTIASIDSLSGEYKNGVKKLELRLYEKEKVLSLGFNPDGHNAIEIDFFGSLYDGHLHIKPKVTDFVYLSNVITSKSGKKERLPYLFDKRGLNSTDKLKVVLTLDRITIGNTGTKYSAEQVVSIDLETQSYESELFEGSKKSRYTNYYERNPKLRAKAIEIHGLKCKACEFDFYATYGERGRGYIEVHHLVPVSELNPALPVDPETDLTVLCSNCHRIAHREKDNMITPSEIKELIVRSKL